MKVIEELGVPERNFASAFQRLKRVVTNLKRILRIYTKQNLLLFPTDERLRTEIRIAFTVLKLASLYRYSQFRDLSDIFDSDGNLKEIYGCNRKHTVADFLRNKFELPVYVFEEHQFSSCSPFTPTASSIDISILCSIRINHLADIVFSKLHDVIVEISKEMKTCQCFCQQCNESNK